MTTKPPQRSLTPVQVRSRLVLEVASEMVGMGDWQHRQARVSLRTQGAEEWTATLFASDSPDAIQEVAQGAVQVAIINPGVVLNLALRGTGPFKEPVPVRAITVIGSFDRVAFAVTEQTGLRSLDEIRERRYPLRISLRGQRDHATHLVLDEVLKAAGFSLDDIRAWGGEVRYDAKLPTRNPQRIGAVERGEVDAIFDEGVFGWTHLVLDLGMRLLPLEEHHLGRLEAIGFRRAAILKEDFPSLPADVPTLDYSGFVVYTSADVPDEVVTVVCRALEARKDRIPSDSGEPPLPLEDMCKDTPEGPLGIPLHPAAERFWRDCGYLD